MQRRKGFCRDPAGSQPPRVRRGLGQPLQPQPPHCLTVGPEAWQQLWLCCCFVWVEMGFNPLAVPAACPLLPSQQHSPREAHQSAKALLHA